MCEKNKIKTPKEIEKNDFGSPQVVCVKEGIEIDRLKIDNVTLWFL